MNRIRFRRESALASAVLGLGLCMPGMSFHGKDGGTGISELREEFSKLHGEATAVVDKAVAEKREITAEEKTANDARFSRLEAIKNLLGEQSKFAKMALEQGTVTLATDPPGKKDVEAPAALDFAKTADRTRFGQAVGTWAGTGNMREEFATITTATQSGIILPVEVLEPLVPSAPNTFRQALGLFGMAAMQTPTTSKINIPVLSATAGGAVAENAGSETENEPGLTESIVSSPATYQSGSVYFSNQSLAAVDFDLVSATVPQMVYSKELGIEAAIAATILADSNITQEVDCDDVAAFTFANLSALEDALPKKFQAGKVIILGATAYSAAKALTFSSGPTILQFVNGVLRTPAGTPVLRSDNLQTLAASHTVGICFSVFGFHLRDAGPANLTRYTQVPAKPNQTGFNLFTYNAYGYAPSAVAKLKTPAS